MRNLKKVLSLTLAFVMLLGMMVVGAAAATDDLVDFDAVAEDNQEAVAVMNAVNVFIGNDKGEFNPNGKLTRAAAAKIVLSMVQGPTTVDALLKNTTSTMFDDMGAANVSWAAGIVDVCANLGIIKGVADRKFNPNGEVTNVQFAAMVARAVDPEGDYNNADTWETNVRLFAAKSGLAESASITDWSAPMTRAQACQVSFNGIQYSPSGENGYVVRGGNPETTVVFSSMMEAMLYQANQSPKGTIEAVTGNDTLAKTVFKLSKSEKDDAFGRKVSIWKVEDEEVYAGDPIGAAVTYTGKVSATQIADDLKGYSVPVGAAGATTTVAINANGDLTTARAQIKIANGADAAALGTADQSPAAAIAALTGSGKLVEVYATNRVIDKVVVVTYSVNTVTSVTERNGRTTYAFSNGLTSKYNDEDNTNVIFDGELAKDDVVTVATVDSKYYVYPTNSFEGNQTAKRTSTVGGTPVVTITVSGEQYVLGSAVTNIASADTFGNSADDATYFVDQYGFIVKSEGAKEDVPEYAMIVNVAGAKVAGSLDNDTGYTVSVRAVLSDGTIADYELAIAEADAAKASESSDPEWSGDALVDGDLYSGNVKVCPTANKDDIDTYAKSTLLSSADGNVFGYTLDNGKMVLKKVAAPTSNMAADSVNQITLAGYQGGTSKAGESTQSSLTALFTSQTVFVLYNVDGNGKWVAEAAVTGTSALNLASGVPGVAIVPNTSDSTATSAVASLVFLKGANAAADTGNYVYVDSTENNAILKDGKTVYTYTGIAPDGSEVEVWSESKLADDVSGLYPYDEDGKVGAAKVLNKAAAHDSGTNTAGASYVVTANKVGNLLKVGDAFVNMTDDTEIVYIADVDDTIENGQKLLVVMDKIDTVAAVFVVAAAPAPTASLSLDATATMNEGTDSATKDLTATFNANGTGLTVTEWAWTSSATSVATVAKDASNGNQATVTLVADGSTNVTVTATLSDASTITATCAVTCNGAKGATVSLAADDNTLDSSSTTSTTVTPTFTAGSSGLTVSSYAYESSDSTKATVGASGNTSTVTYAGQGSVTITVKATLSNGAVISGNCSITCS